MNKDSLNGVSTIAVAISTGPNIGALGNNVVSSNSTVLDVTTSTASVVENLGSLVGKSTLGVGVAVGSASLLNNLGKIVDGATLKGEVKVADVRSASADVAGILGSLAIAAQVVAVGTSLPVVLGVALVITSAGLTISAMAAGDDVEKTPEIKAMHDAARDFLDRAGDSAKAILDAMLDPKFWDKFAEQGEKLLESLLKARVGRTRLRYAA